MKLNCICLFRLPVKEAKDNPMQIPHHVLDTVIKKSRPDQDTVLHMLSMNPKDLDLYLKIETTFVLVIFQSLCNSFSVNFTPKYFIFCHKLNTQDK